MARDCQIGMASMAVPIECRHFICIFLVFAVFSLVLCEEYMVQVNGRTCPYFGVTRYSTVAEGLVNCSWYGQDACCKRTEVTSVFSNADPLYKASTSCKHQMNYLMCYFCSPEQHVWIKDKVKVCADFCASLYFHCKEAYFNGSMIGSNYEDGQTFCESQNFEVVDSKINCFKFDPTVFASGESLLPACFAVIVLTAVSLHISTLLRAT
ncbi:uncharacterized protein LOC135475748 [Liolophura sinensis]|uniref:uncharacterized protein LOC135475748 n=1 Tax=Liolophura sinensis TaxID=3198878 RepID=UPI0031584D24